MPNRFLDKLASAVERNQSLLCVGLDPDPAQMPVKSVFEFNRAIIDATRDLVCAYKPNLPFYEALGMPGLQALEDTVSHIRREAPGVVIVGDAKRGDIASTNVHYARALFEVWGFDAAVVNGYAGGEALEPFLEYTDRGVFVWCRSSNPGAGEFQDLTVHSNGEEMPLYAMVAARASQWNRRGNVGLVVGARYPKELETVRMRCPEMPILVPGVGAQGGDLPASVASGSDAKGRNLIISSSRGVIYASRGPSDFAQAAREAATGLRDRINDVLAKEGHGW